MCRRGACPGESCRGCILNSQHQARARILIVAAASIHCHSRRLRVVTLLAEHFEQIAPVDNEGNVGCNLRGVSF